MRRTHVLAATICLLLGATMAGAGAWPRKQGHGFASTTVRLSWPRDLAKQASLKPSGQYYTFYAEYGLTDRLTAGLDLGRSVSGDGKSIAFLRLPLRDRANGLKIAAELGLGKIDGRAVLRPGLSLGLGRARGWLSAEAQAEVSPSDGRTDYKLDFTWGRSLRNDRKLVVQMQTGKPRGDPAFARFAPSVVLPLRGTFKAEIGGSWELTGERAVGLTFGLWSEF
ncbi:hypothetical protein M4578_08440 [Salipiger sp. P9]|uniref:hypothetical protein n=1 Tax=Salipiger pentaromativorans TaxID=2943193 RepID=UPI0021585177|nr:hypothetical protein [Salipiger pentaromativorans]MCR8547853.1 hypothetical protein [Salipiger pentaromativorans]